MADRIKEDQIASIPTQELLRYTDFFVAGPNGYELGEPVFRVREIPPETVDGQPPRVMAVRHLVIEVPDPADEAARDRVRTAITQRFAAR